MKFKNPYLDNKNKIELLQKWIIVHSMLYYVYDTNIVDDYMYDMNSKQLDALIRKDPEAFKESKWRRVFKGSGKWAGFQLTPRLNPSERVEIQNVCEMLIKKFKGGA